MMAFADVPVVTVADGSSALIEIAKIGGPLAIVSCFAIWVLWKLHSQVIVTVVTALQEVRSALVTFTEALKENTKSNDRLGQTLRDLDRK